MGNKIGIQESRFCVWIIHWKIPASRQICSVCLYTQVGNVVTESEICLALYIRVIISEPFIPFFILYSLKTLENLRFFGVFMGYKMGTLVENGLKCCYPLFQPSKYIFTKPGWFCGSLNNVSIFISIFIRNWDS